MWKNCDLVQMSRMAKKFNIDVYMLKHVFNNICTDRCDSFCISDITPIIDFGKIFLKQSIYNNFCLIYFFNKYDNSLLSATFLCFFIPLPCILSAIKSTTRSVTLTPALNNKAASQGAITNPYFCFSFFFDVFNASIRNL